MAIDIRKYFNEDLPAAMAKNPDVARKISAKFQINIYGDGGGEWSIDVSDTGPKCLPGSAGGADCTITIENVDFQHYYDNPQANGTQLFFAGKMKVSGNPTLVMKFYKVFQLTSP